MPWESHYKYFKPATGLPPHVILYAYIKSLDVKIEDMPKKMEELLDRRQMAGPLSLDQIARAVENGSRITAMANDISALMTMVQENTVRLAAAAPVPASVDVNQTTQRPFARLHAQYKHSTDGKYRRVPSSWQFPKISLQAMYQYWHYGDAANNIPPAKYLQKSDVEYLGKAANIRLCELKKVMTAIDNEATAKGHPPSEHMDLRQAASCYYHGESIISTIIP